MNEYKIKEFNLPDIDGISKNSLEIHLGLYAGYVKNFNEHISKLPENAKDNTILSALTRRLSFELAGIKNHELFFEALTGGAKEINTSSNLNKCIKENYGDVSMLKDCIKKTAMVMRGIGWVAVVYDKEKNALHTYFITDHENSAVSLPAILMLDMWEHAYMVDYKPAEKEKYVDAYLNAINWSVIEKNFDEAC